MGTPSNLFLTSMLCCLLASPAFADSKGVGVSDAPIAKAPDPGSVYGVGVAVAQAAEPANPGTKQSEWQFSAQPYLWMSGMKGDMGVVEQVEPVGVDLSFIDIVGAMKFALMGNFEARKGRFVASADALFLSMGASDNIEIREVDFLDVELDTRTFIATMAAGYRAVDQPGVSLDVLAGPRIYSMKTSLDLEGPNRSFSGSKTETWVDPVIAVRFDAALSENWSVRAYGDVGGFGIASDHTWQLSGAVDYRISRRWSLSAGWRHLDIDFDHNGFVFDAAMSGPILGAIYRF